MRGYRNGYVKAHLIHVIHVKKRIKEYKKESDASIKECVKDSIETYMNECLEECVNAYLDAMEVAKNGRKKV